MVKFVCISTLRLKWNEDMRTGHICDLYPSNRQPCSQQPTQKYTVG